MDWKDKRPLFERGWSMELPVFYRGKCVACGQDKTGTTIKTVTSFGGWQHEEAFAVCINPQCTETTEQINAL